MSTYAATIFCTTTDVRNRALSVEKLAALTKDNSTPYAVTVALSVFTGATYANGLTVSFQTTGTLPAPLVSGTAYYIVNTSGNTFKVAASVNGTAITITGVPVGDVTVTASLVDLFIQSKITLAKDVIRQDLINYFQEKIPGRISSMLAFKRSQMNAMQSDFSRTLELLDRGTGSWNYPTYGYVTFEGLFYSVNNYQTFGQIPALRVNYGAPTSGVSGTFAALAVNGDLLADILGGNLYIDRETDSPPVAPVWSLFLPSDAIDYLLNPAELSRAMVSRTIAEMVVDATWRNITDSQQLVEKGAKNWAIDFWREEYGRDLERGLSCVDVNISGSGLMNDWMRGITRSEVVVCG